MNTKKKPTAIRRLYAALLRLSRRMQRAVAADRVADIGRNNRRRKSANSGRNALAGSQKTA
jgi:hypothetical protein